MDSINIMDLGRAVGTRQIHLGWIWDGPVPNQNVSKATSQATKPKVLNGHKLNSTEQNSHLHLGKPESILFYSVHLGHSKGCEPVS